MDSPDFAGAPTSPTQYTLDLDALNLGDTESLSLIPEANVDRIQSDDIDGPTDFTINLGKYINGEGPKRRTGTWNFSQLNDALDEESSSTNTTPRGPHQAATAPEESHQDAKAGASDDMEHRVNLDQINGNDNGNGNDSSSEQDAYSVRNGSDDGAPSEDRSDNGDMTTYIPLDLTEGSITPEQEQESSIWEPQYNSSSLRYSNLRRSLLQPTVEDYNSDLTPARPHSTVPQPSFHLTPDPPRRPVSAFNLRPSPRRTSPGRPSSPTFSPSRAPPPTKADGAPLDEHSDLHALKTELHQLRDAHSQAQNAVETLSAQLEKERQNARSLKSDLELTRERNREIEHAIEASRADHRREMRDLVDELGSLRQSEQELLRLADQRAKDIEAARRSERDANDLANDRAKELDQIHESEDAELQDLRWQLQQAQDAEQTAKDNLEDLRSQMEEQGRAHDEEVQRLGRDLAEARSDAHRAQDAEKLAQENLRLLRQQMNDHATALRDETQRLRDELDEAQRQEESARSDADRHYHDLEQLKATKASDKNTVTFRDFAAGTTNDEAMQRAESLRQMLENQLHEARTQITAITRDRDSDLEARNKAENERKAAQEARKKLAVQLAQLGRERKAEQEARERAEDEIKVLKEELEIEQGFSRLDDVIELPEIDAPELDIRKHQSQGIDTVNAGYEKVLKMSESLTAEVEALKRQMQDQQSKYEAGMNDIKSQYDSKMKEIKSQHKTNVEGVMLQLVAQKEEDTRLRAAEIEEHRRAIDIMQEHMTLINQSSEASAAHIEALKQQCTITQDSLNQARQALEEKKAAGAGSQKQDSTLVQESLKKAQQVVEEKKAIEALLKNALHSLKEKEAHVKALKQQYEIGQESLKTAQEALQTKKDVEKAYDERVLTTVREREDIYKSKLKEARKREQLLEQKTSQLEKDRKIMSKALMIQWGREECGIDENSKTQKYRYKYAKPSQDKA